MTEVTPLPKGKTIRGTRGRGRTVKGVKAECTRIHSLIVRATKGPACQCGCGRPCQEAAHIIGRNYSHTRTDLDNAYALAKTCHTRFHDFPDEWVAFVDRTIGRAEYDRLKAKAEAGVGVKFDWFSELDRLRAIWKSIETRVA
jgi:hypothetical protein